MSSPFNPPPPGYAPPGYSPQGYPPPGYGAPPGYPQGGPPQWGGARPQDDQNLNLLGILFYVYGGFVALAAVGIASVGLLAGAVIGAASVGARGGGPGAAAVGLVEIVLFGGIGVLLIAKAVLMFLAGKNLRQRSGYVLIMVGACLCLLNLPFGTALGVATLVMMSKPEIKARFGRPM